MSQPINEQNSEPHLESEFSRRDFITVALAAAACAGCQSAGLQSGSKVTRTGPVDAGPASAYASDGVYSNYRYAGFFIIRRGDKLEAISSLCTHRQCKLDAQPDKTFYCPCHGSQFDATGHVTEGPATVDLPVFATTVNAAGRLIVNAPV